MSLIDWIESMLGLSRATVHQTSPPAAPVPTPFSAYLNVEPTSGVTAVLTVDTGDVIQGSGQQHIDFLNIPARCAKWGGWVELSADGYTSVRKRVSVEAPALLDDATKQPLGVQLERSRVDLPSLTRRGQFFALVNGAFLTLIGCSDFALYARFLNGEDITPILEERSALGFNILRVWLLNTSVFRIVPSDYGDAFYTRLPAFCQLAAKYGLYIQFTVFTQAKSLMPPLDDEQTFLNRVADSIRDETNWIGEVVNEFNNADNDTQPGLKVPSFGLWAQGSNSGDPGPNPPKTPVLRWQAVHSFSAMNQWQRDIGHQGMEAADATGVPSFMNENARFGDMANSVDVAYDAAAGATLLCGGAVFHCWAGKLSTLFGQSGQAGAEHERPCAEAWVAGAKSVPLEFQDGVYVHETGHEGPGILRAYGKRLPDGREWIVPIRG